MARGELSEIDPRIREGEMSTVHFRYVKVDVHPLKWLVTSIETDQWIFVLLDIDTGAYP